MMLAREALAARTESANGWMQGTPPGRTVRRVIDGLIEIELVDRSMTLAARIFTSVLPVMIAASTLSSWHLTARTIKTQFGFDPAELSSTSGTVDTTDPSFAAFGVVGLLMIAISGTSFARALARIYGKIWNVPSINLRDAWRWLVVLFAVALSSTAIGLASELTSVRFIGPPLAVAGEFAVWMAVWTLSPYLLTMGTLEGRVLWATGALTAAALTTLHVGGRILLPRITASAQHQFGSLGLVFTAISWLFVMSVVIVGAAVITKALALDEAYIGRYLRGPDAVASERSAESLPENDGSHHQ
ncbi:MULTISPECIES: hypothetical protein [Rhodococcus]|uniref:Uncharacterized protein n=1 Tax=Rhodococcus oxybenzonivorans TaxID=1990687 RepID=A0AAE4V0B2_9NOCA|nr:MULTISPECIES: hypothetical protein [Rhodococcus]MDV7242817.1 hypothetical protein [Rhodococcus oxybenzonivorans]MDV7265604.1 hypothetical protein [Rhodococcus oxybenzonivorans]MDV7275221.1 hypothetical protein [Rhodococcus oxybenzonivorans]MDV7334924.1 hypothetical protein [Rhodococcus oxybenzonivorans]MDV7345078.1 hypothetical protein [Rhodococcus oxybenzonivorans]